MVSGLGVHCALASVMISAVFKGDSAEYTPLLFFRVGLHIRQTKKQLIELEGIVTYPSRVRKTQRPLSKAVKCVPLRQPI